MTRLLILLTKIIYGICKLLGKNGSVYPGRVLFRRDIHALNKIKYPKYVIGVTGSSGKGSTVNTIAGILKSNGYKVVYNESGSNAVRGIYTCIMRHTSVITKKVQADVLLLELDERHISLAFPICPLTHLVITNITRDQPARNAHPDVIFDVIMKSINESTELIINADDPIVNEAKLIHKGKIVTYGIDENKYQIKKNFLNCVDAAYCPVCHKKLVYKFYHYGHLGNYHCKNKCFARGKVNYNVTDLDLDKKRMKINDNLVCIDKNVFFAAYYTVAAYAVCSQIGLSNVDIINYLNNNTHESKRMKEYNFNNRTITMIESKNENNLSYLQSLEYIKEQKGKKTIIIGFDNVSRRYKVNDLSWLYDVDFELLNDDSIDKIFCIGRFKYDVACRLLIAGIDSKKLFLVDDVNNLLNDVKKYSKGSIYTMVCFDMTEVIRNLLRSENDEN